MKRYSVDLDFSTRYFTWIIRDTPTYIVNETGIYTSNLDDCFLTIL